MADSVQLGLDAPVLREEPVIQDALRSSAGPKARAFRRRLREAQRRRAAMKATLGPGPLSAPRGPQALGHHDPR